MSTRDELIEIVARDPQSAGGDTVWATDLVDAYRAEVLRGALGLQLVDPSIEAGDGS